MHVVLQRRHVLCELVVSMQVYVSVAQVVGMEFLFA